MKRNLFTLLALALFVAVATGGRAAAEDNRLAAVPFTFVGTAAGCGGPAGSQIVTAAWLAGMGLPDNGGLNGAPDTRSDPHFGLLLSKNGLTTDCSSSGARIRGAGGMAVTAGFHLGFDYRNGGHCGAGAPRFNVAWKLAGAQGFSFVGGCSNDSTPTPAPQDAQWTRVRFDVQNPAESFPIIPAGAEIVSISILFDEGTDVGTVQDPMGIGLAVIDNIDINGTLITRGSNVDPNRAKNKDRDNGDDNDQGENEKD
jgi:hypothetical protein